MIFRAVYIEVHEQRITEKQRFLARIAELGVSHYCSLNPPSVYSDEACIKDESRAPKSQNIFRKIKPMPR